ncbi:MAG TPA: hypothetical protein VIJ39_04345 [Solirubrobacteraceae bacterium]
MTGPQRLSPTGLAAATRAPSGFTPSANEEFDVIEGSPVKGTFRAVSGGFTGDYSYESSEPPYVGVVYNSHTGSTGTTGSTTTGTAGTTGTTGTTQTVTKATPPEAKVIGVTSSVGNVTVKLTCPMGAATCGVITVKVTVTEHLKLHGRTTTKTVTVANGSVSLKAGGRVTLKLHINSAGKALLRKHHSLQALATVIQGTSKVASEKVTLKR